MRTLYNILIALAMLLTCGVAMPPLPTAYKHFTERCKHEKLRKD